MRSGVSSVMIWILDMNFGICLAIFVSKQTAWRPLQGVGFEIVQFLKNMRYAMLISDCCEVYSSHEKRLQDKIDGKEDVFTREAGYPSIPPGA